MGQHKRGGVVVELFRFHLIVVKGRRRFKLVGPLMGAVPLLSASSEEYHNPMQSRVSESLCGTFRFDFGCFFNKQKSEALIYISNHEEYAFGGDDSSFL
jgi:hypothetical protein